MLINSLLVLILSNSITLWRDKSKLYYKLTTNIMFLSGFIVYSIIPLYGFIVYSIRCFLFLIKGIVKLQGLFYYISLIQNIPYLFFDSGSNPDSDSNPDYESGSDSNTNSSYLESDKGSQSKIDKGKGKAKEVVTEDFKEAVLEDDKESIPEDDKDSNGKDSNDKDSNDNDSNDNDSNDNDQNEIKTRDKGKGRAIELSPEDTPQQNNYNTSDEEAFQSNLQKAIYKSLNDNNDKDSLQKGESSKSASAINKGDELDPKTEKEILDEKTEIYYLLHYKKESLETQRRSIAIEYNDLKIEKENNEDYPEYNEIDKRISEKKDSYDKIVDEMNRIQEDINRNGFVPANTQVDEPSDYEWSGYGASEESSGKSNYSSEEETRPSKRSKFSSSNERDKKSNDSGESSSKSSGESSGESYYSSEEERRPYKRTKFSSFHENDKKSNDSDSKDNNKNLLPFLVYYSKWRFILPVLNFFSFVFSFALFLSLFFFDFDLLSLDFTIPYFDLNFLDMFIIIFTVKIINLLRRVYKTYNKFVFYFKKGDYYIILINLILSIIVVIWLLYIK